MVKVRTMAGLCYKLNISKSLIPIEMDVPTNGLGLLIKSSIKEGIDKFTAFRLMIASENTWQGIVYGRWPYINVPPIITAELVPGLTHFSLIDLAENNWNYIRKTSNAGKTNFSGCMENNDKESCLSIFDTRSMNMKESRYLMYQTHPFFRSKLWHV